MRKRRQTFNRVATDGRTSGFGGGVGGGRFVGKLDSYTSGMAAAWSCARRLLTGYTGSLIRVRRSSDSTEQDIGYTATTGVLDTASLLSFVSGGNGFVTKIYDQSGLGRDLVQATASAQQRIVSAGSLFTLGGMPAMKTTVDGAQGYATATFTAYTGKPVSAFARAAVANSFGNNRVLSLGSTNSIDYSPATVGELLARNASTLALFSYRAGTIASAAISAYSTQFIASIIYNGTTGALDTGTATASGAFTSSCNFNQFYAAGYQGAGSFSGANGDFWAEAVIYTADQTANKTAIRTALAS